MNVDEFKYCPYCGFKFTMNRCGSCFRSLYSSPHPNVSILIFDLSAMQVLLVEEQKPDSKKDLRWEIPGGFVSLVPPSKNNLGESLEEALERELKEEIGHQNVKILMKNLTYLKSFGDTYTDSTPLIVTYFFSIIKKTDLIPSSNKDTAKIEWFDVHNLPTFEYNSDRQAIIYARKKILNDFT